MEGDITCALPNKQMTTTRAYDKWGDLSTHVTMTLWKISNY